MQIGRGRLEKAELKKLLKTNHCLTLQFQPTPAKNAGAAEAGSLGLTTTRMRLSTFQIFVACLLLPGCSHFSPSSDKIWRASVDNGDKPGIGIELIRTPQGVRGWVYLLDPNKPRDFTAGSRRRMEIEQISEREIRFSVQWLPSRRDEMILQLVSPLENSTVQAVLLSAERDDSPTEFVFVRTE